MEKVLCSGSSERTTWAVGLCFSSALLLSLEALRPNACAWMGFNSEQSFALSAALATVSMFMATFLLAQLASSRSSIK